MSIPFPRLRLAGTVSGHTVEVHFDPARACLLEGLLLHGVGQASSNLIPEIVHLLLEFGKPGFSLHAFELHVVLVNISGCRRELICITVVDVRFVGELLVLQGTLHKHISGLLKRSPDLSAPSLGRCAIDGVLNSLAVRDFHTRIEGWDKP
ncbi:MAG: hypothetical protein ABSF90_15605 [Syntrophobacteraceae bacterium]